MNGTYPGRRLLFSSNDALDDEESSATLGRRRPDARILLRQRLQELQIADHEAAQRRRLRHQRKLAYYTDLVPAKINSVTDNPLCVGSAENPEIMCAIVSSTVCVVLEDDDDPEAVRALMIAGLRQAVDSGDFLRRIPAEDLQMNTR